MESRMQLMCGKRSYDSRHAGSGRKGLSKMRSSDCEWVNAYNVPLDTKQVILGTFFPANLLAFSTEKKVKNEEKPTITKPKLT